MERDRREKKISEWITLARQHLENQAFRQAREALDNVLQIKPNDTDALNLAAEVAGASRKFRRSASRNASCIRPRCRLGKKATSPRRMTKLEVLIAMDRDQPEADTGRGSSYQGFYNQVHSEHNAHEEFAGRSAARALGG